MCRWLGSLLVVAVALAGAMSLSALAYSLGDAADGRAKPMHNAGDAGDLVLRNDITPPGPWALTASYCYFSHCTERDRVPTYWRSKNSFETGEDCVARIEEITKGQSRRMALHRTFFCGRTFEDPGPDDLAKEHSEFDDPVPDDLKPWE